MVNNTASTEIQIFYISFEADNLQLFKMSGSTFITQKMREIFFELSDLWSNDD